mgnify:CR=1 FL=1
MVNAIYMDAAASTPPYGEVLDKYVYTASSFYANPASAHQYGKATAQLLDDARTHIREILGLPNWQVIFTAGATESNNWVLRQVPLPAGARVVISAVEHASVRNAAMQAARDHQWNLEFLPVRPDGTFTAETIEKLIHNPPDALSIMAVNNETGVILPVVEIARQLREAGARTFFHVDAVHAVANGVWPASVDGISALTLSAHKFHGPRGCGMLLLAPHVQLPPLLVGGAQENGLRSGTVNVPGAVASAFALALAWERRNTTFFTLGKQLAQRVVHELPGVKLLGEGAPRVPWICMFAVPGMRGDALVRMLDIEGVEVSSGSACASGRQGLSPTLSAMKADFRMGYVRFSLHTLHTQQDIDEAISRFSNVFSRYALPPL